MWMRGKILSCIQADHRTRNISLPLNRVLLPFDRQERCFHLTRIIRLSYTSHSPNIKMHDRLQWIEWGPESVYDPIITLYNF